MSRKSIRLLTIYDNVPKDAIVPSECRRYPFDLASEEDHTALKGLTIEILTELAVDWAECLPGWSYIERMAAIRASCRGHERFVVEMKEKNPTVIIESQYTRGYTKVSCRCAVCGYTWRAIPDALLKGHGCPGCGWKASAAPRRKTHGQFLKELQAVNPTVKVLGRYVNATTKIECLCKACGNVWLVKPDNLLHGSSCPRCVRRRIGISRRKTHEQFLEDLERANPNIEALGKYESKKIKIPCRCKTCGHVWNVTPDSLLQGTGCPACKTRNFVNRMAEKRKTATKS